MATASFAHAVRECARHLNDGRWALAARAAHRWGPSERLAGATVACVTPRTPVGPFPRWLERGWALAHLRAFGADNRRLRHGADVLAVLCGGGAAGAAGADAMLSRDGVRIRPQDVLSRRWGGAAPAVLAAAMRALRRHAPPEAWPTPLAPDVMADDALFHALLDARTVNPRALLSAPGAGPDDPERFLAVAHVVWPRLTPPQHARLLRLTRPALGAVRALVPVLGADVARYIGTFLMPGGMLSEEQLKPPRSNTRPICRAAE